MKAASWIPAVIVLLCSATATPARAQADPVGDGSLAIFLDSARPLRLRFAELSGRYRLVSVSALGDSFQNYIQSMNELSGTPTNLYYTTGETVALDGETYLVAYRRPLETASKVFGDNDSSSKREPVQPRKAAPNDDLALSLLNLRTIRSLTDIRPFSAARDIMTAEEGNAASLRALVALGGLLQKAIESNGGMMLAFDTASAKTSAALSAFVHSTGAWRDLRHDRPYTVNPKISGLNVSDVLNLRYLPAAYEDAFTADGTRGVLFLDGHAERVNRERWQKLIVVSPRIKPVVVSDPPVPSR